MASTALHLLFLSLLLSFLFLPLFAASNITPNSSLSATNNNSSWVSPSGEFAFGFIRLNDSNPNPILLAIWFAKVPDNPIVWHANTTAPVLEKSTVELTTTGLILNAPDGEQLWKAEPSSTVSSAEMLDSGNFVLLGTDSHYVWKSFDHPTDTILPTQTLPLGGSLRSRLSESNYSKGRFQLQFTTDGDLQLNPIGLPGDYVYGSYYNSQTSSTNLSQPAFQLVFNESGDIFVVKNNSDPVELSWNRIFPNPDTYYRATLDFDGVFRQYSYSKAPAGGSDQGWSTLRYIPDKICFSLTNPTGGGACGFNSYCTMSVNDGKPNCQCPPGYSLVDPNDQFGGCRPNLPLGCGVDDGSTNPEEMYDVEEVDFLNWPLGDYEILRTSNRTQCVQACLHDCSCAVAIFNGANCYKKNLPLLNGRRESALAIIKQRKAIPKLKKDKKVTLWQIVFGGSALFNVLLLLITSLALLLKNREKSERGVHDDSNVLGANLRVFTFKELKEAAEEFKEEAGRGASGIVYKGVLKSCSKNSPIAIKKLDKLSLQGEKEFKAEMDAIGKTHHKNLVQLLGYCNEGPHRLLVYEFMSRGNLANYLFGLPRPEWHKRTQLAMGIARGLAYLHEECSAPIIHCDIKPQNILLDEFFIPRISDFGLAKMLMLNQTRTDTGIRGTRGYVAPEWFKNVPVTVKVDVYSFGVVLLEIICCRKAVGNEYGEMESLILTDWAYDCCMEERVERLVENDEAAIRDISKLRRWVTTALCCVEEDPLKRPTMKTVIQMLEGYVDIQIHSRASFDVENNGSGV